MGTLGEILDGVWYGWAGFVLCVLDGDGACGNGEVCLDKWDLGTWSRLRGNL